MDSDCREGERGGGEDGDRKLRMKTNTVHIIIRIV